MELELPEAAAIPGAARLLLKLFATSSAWRPTRIGTGGPLKITCRRGSARVDFVADSFSEGVDGHSRELFIGLFGGAPLFDLGKRFAAEIARLEVLQVLTQHMLASSDVDASLRILLTGLTSGDGLGFNRAAVYVFDEIRNRFVGSRAIGPASAEEAHQIWEALTLEGQTLEHIITRASAQEVMSGLQGQVYEVEVIPGENDEVTRVLAASGPLRFANAPVNSGLAHLHAAGPFVLAAIQSRGTPLALVFVDNLYSGGEIGTPDLDSLKTFLSQTSLVLDNLTLLRDVERLARYDCLTGVFTRREFEARMAVEEMRCLRASHACSLLVVDLDNFKAVNDNFGHSAGDDVLRKTGELLRQTLRTHDLVGRFGGDEFTVLLPETAGTDLEQIIRRLGLLAWAQKISMSIGGASFPDDCEVPSALFAIADRNLLTAKRAGRKRACIGNGGHLFGLAGDS